MESNLTNTCISGGVYIVLYWRFTTLKPLKTSWAHPRQRWKKITRLVIVFGGHEALLQNYWMESWLEWAFVSPILDYELPSRETGGNKHRPKIVLSNAMQCSAFQILPGTQNARRRHWWLHPEDNATLIGFYPALFISCRILRLALYKSHFQIGNPANGQLPLIAILLRQEMNNEINF